MEWAVSLAVAASFCTAASSVCQRLGTRSLEAKGLRSSSIFLLVRRPVWLAGLASMILGFACQLGALHFGPLALVQPILSLELVFVFACIAVMGSRRMQWRDWIAAVALSGGLGLFLFAASPSGGRSHAPGSLWWLAGAVTFAIVLLSVAATSGLGRLPEVAPARRAAILGIATGTGWGFVAGVIKELSTRLGQGGGAVISSWPPYVLIGVGSVTVLLANHALAAGPLAASQPGFTIMDPLAATVLGSVLFREHLRAGVPDLAGEALGLVVMAAAVTVLSHSHLITGESARMPNQRARSSAAASPGSQAGSERLYRQAI
ncbi:MAG TPA: DMT family transporter [Trebonia sp.]|nr:DMT family transporter [Trebonia sp.]